MQFRMDRSRREARAVVPGEFTTAVMLIAATRLYEEIVAQGVPVSAMLSINESHMSPLSTAEVVLRWDEQDEDSRQARMRLMRGPETVRGVCDDEGRTASVVVGDTCMLGAMVSAFDVARAEFFADRVPLSATVTFGLAAIAPEGMNDAAGRNPYGFEFVARWSEADDRR